MAIGTVWADDTWADCWLDCWADAVERTYTTVPFAVTVATLATARVQALTQWDAAVMAQGDFDADVQALTILRATVSSLGED